VVEKRRGGVRNEYRKNYFCREAKPVHKLKVMKWRVILGHFHGLSQSIPENAEIIRIHEIHHGCFIPNPSQKVIIIILQFATLTKPPL
jgi:hypothetical protein